MTAITEQAERIVAHPCAARLAVLMSTGRLMAFDIETDTSPLTEDERQVWGADARRGLDPRFSRVTAVAFHAPLVSLVIDHDDEATILRDVHRVISALPSNVAVAGWNSAGFDVPFLRHRFAEVIGSQPFAVAPISGDQPKYPPNPGLGEAVEGTWLGHGLIDIYRTLRPAFARYPEVPTSLKPFAKALGMDAIEVDRTAMHELSRDERHDYVASDARLTWRIAGQAAKVRVPPWPTLAREFHAIEDRLD